MKPLISYYGGKQRIASKIVPLLPPHTVYVEPFAGGLAVLFKKGLPDNVNKENLHYPGTKSDTYREVINDKDDLLINFYRQAKKKDTRGKLIDEIQATLYSKSEHNRAKEICKNPIKYSDLEKAWAYYVNSHMSFANIMGSGWGFGMEGKNNGVTFQNKIELLDKACKRLSKCFIECDDAIKIIQKWDKPHTCFYCDPPYPGSDQGHYSGYTIEHYQQLIDTLDNCQGSYVLSNYAQDIEPKYDKKIEIKATMSASKDKTANKERTEILWIKDRSRNCSPELKRILSFFGENPNQMQLF